MKPEPVGVPGMPPNNDTYSQAVQLGELIFVSGQLGRGAGGVLPPDLRQQTRQAIENIEAILRAAGSGLDQVAKVNIYLTDFSRLAEMNEVYRVYFPHRPAKTSVEVTRLDQGALIEIEVVAHRR